MSTLALKLILTPTLIGLVSLASRRWGPVVGGLLVGLPLTSGPVAFLLALQQATAFAARAAVGTMAGIMSVAAFAVAYGRAAAKYKWPGATLLGWSAYLGTTLGFAFLELRLLAVLVSVVVTLGIAMAAGGTARRREWAVRAALGASRARLARATLLESLVLAALGGGAALPIVGALLRVVEGYLLRTTPVEIGDWGDGSRLAVDRPAALALCLALTAGAALVCRLASSASQRREDLVPALKADGEAGGASAPLRLGGRRLLVVSQAALSTALLLLALLAVRSLGQLGGQSLGFETRERASRDSTCRPVGARRLAPAWRCACSTRFAQCRA